MGGPEELRHLLPVHVVVETDGEPAAVAVMWRSGESRVLRNRIALGRIAEEVQRSPALSQRGRWGEPTPLKIANRRRPTRKTGRPWSSPSSASSNAKQIRRTCSSTPTSKASPLITRSCHAVRPRDRPECPQPGQLEISVDSRSATPEVAVVRGIPPRCRPERPNGPWRTLHDGTAWTRVRDHPPHRNCSAAPEPPKAGRLCDIVIPCAADPTPTPVRWG